MLRENMAERTERNYELCWYCQCDNGSKINNPKLNTRYKNDQNGLEEAYKKVVKQFKRLLVLKKLPDDTYIDSFAYSIDEEEYGFLIYEKGAVWHSVCRNKHDQQKVDRAEKEYAKRQASGDSNPSPVKTRRSSANQLDVSDGCIEKVCINVKKLKYEMWLLRI